MNTLHSSLRSSVNTHLFSSNLSPKCKHLAISGRPGSDVTAHYQLKKCDLYPSFFFFLEMHKFSPEKQKNILQLSPDVVNANNYTSLSRRSNSSWSPWCSLLSFLSWFTFCRKRKKYLENRRTDSIFVVFVCFV